MLKLTKAALGCAAVMHLAGCAADMGDETAVGGVENVATTEEAIRNGMDVPVGSKYSKGTVTVNGLGGTIIGPRHVLTTSKHWLAPGLTVKFYNGALPSGVTRTVSRIYAPYSVDSYDYLDTDGKWAAYMVLELSSNIPAGYTPARLPTSWPGSARAMVQVGAGSHDGIVNPENVMRYRSTNSYSASNANGHVLLEAAIDNGDQGGPVYDAYANDLLVHGVAHDNVFEWATRGMYISTAYHFWDIAKAVGLTKEDNVNRSGSDYAQTDYTLQIDCAARCLADTKCKAYTLTTLAPNGSTDPVRGRCFLKDGVPGPTGAPGRFSGVKLTTGPCQLEGNYCRL